MAPDPLTLVKLLASAALMAGAVEYAAMVRRRVGMRADAAERAMFEKRGLWGLARVFLAQAAPATRESYKSPGAAELP